jgi:pyridoxamine 5'-phosphate oxidase
MTESYIPRANYDFPDQPIDSDQAHSDPLEQFRIWFEKESIEADGDGNRMALATADRSGSPSLRMVLLKQYTSSGFLFFTDYRSRKATELDQNPHAALLFYWQRRQRQVRIEGRVEKVSREVSEDYFSRRPRSSQAGATTSHQSAPLPDRPRFEQQVETLVGQGDPIVCPEHWGGYRLVADRYEFWQGQPGRIHRRILYQPEGGDWHRSELQP